MILIGQNKPKRQRKVYWYDDVELTDASLAEYIDTVAFKICELQKKSKYSPAQTLQPHKKQIQASKCQNVK